MIAFFLLLFASLGGCAQPAPTGQSNVTVIDSGDAKIFCRTIGKGDPLVVVHGGPGLGYDYLLPQFDRLAENNLVILYDQRGCGKSTGEIREDTMNVPTFVQDLENLRKAFHFEKISLLGHSWGGLLTMHYAIEHPERVDKLVLTNTYASSEDLSLFVDEWTRRIAPFKEEIDRIEAMQDFQNGDPALHEHWNRVIMRTYCHVPKHADSLNLQMSRSEAINCYKICQFFWVHTMSKPFDLHPSLKKLEIPTLVVHGDDDPVPPVVAKNIQETLCHSKMVVLKDCGHFPYVEKTDEYFRVLSDFLNNE